jgi:hypothetical protein
VLRIPNFFEPYWYGDEGIYLTIGNALRGGEHLYRDIVDHKTPIIYYLAMVPNQFSFRILTTIWMLITTVLFYSFAQKIFKNRWVLKLATVVFALATTLPALEGNIPNGELFVMGFVLAAITAISHVPFVKSFLASQEYSSNPKDSPATIKWSFIAGILASLAILTKVPALFDAVALGLFGWLTLSGAVLRRKKNFLSLLITIIKSCASLAVGLVIPLLFSVIYFQLRGSFNAYLNFGLLYNFHYAGNWQLHTSPLMNSLFSLPGKVALVALLLILLTLLARFFSHRFQFLFGWFLLAVFASLLSNRPYPHYFLQLVPPTVLLLSWGVQNVLTQLRPSSKNKEQRQKLELVFVIGAVVLLSVVKNVIGVEYYKNYQYYLRFWKLATGQISQQEYQNQFDSLVADNRAAAEIIRRSPDSQFFIWGTNPMLYAQTGKYPVGRFTVSFHIKDLRVLPETLANLQAQKPRFIVVMKDEKDTFPELNTWLAQEYMPNVQFEDYTLWMRQN